jgi:hypothetical protein
MDVVITYALIESGRDGVGLLMRDRKPDDISRLNVAGLAGVFLEACKYAQGVLPRLRTGVPLHDDRDDVFIREITDAAVAWDKILSTLSTERPRSGQ